MQTEYPRQKSISCFRYFIFLANLIALWIIISFNTYAQQKDLPIVTTFTIIQDIAQNVGADVLIVNSITKPGAEIHEYEPTPLDIVKASKAQLVLWNGFGLERWFEKFYGSLQGIPGVMLTQGIEPISIIEGPYKDKPNPHSWMSPKNALVYVENIRKSFVNLRPDKADQINKNAKEYSEKIKLIDNLLDSKLKTIPEEQRWLVSSEGAFSYLIRDYQMKELFLWPVNADQEGTPQQVRNVIDKVRTNKIPVVFSESTISDKAMRQVVKETGVRFGGLLYVDSLTDSNGVAPTYLKLLEYNAETIVKGFIEN